VEESALESKYKSLFQTNTELGRRTFQMIDNLLIWALQENDQFYTEKEKIDLKRMVEQVVYVYEPMLQQKSLHLDCEVDERAVVYMDRNSLKIVLRNLIDNAIKYSTEGGRIQIQSESNENDHGLLTIADNGLGMSKEILTQVQKASVSPGGIDVDGRRGTGIGLNLCSSLLKQNGGEMKIESEEGQGTTIKLKLKNYEKN
jgi:signal transduction histidine kinase